jgi:serine/threonine protein kinase
MIRFADAESRVEEYERILSGDIKVPIKAGYSDAVRDLLLKLLTRDPDERIGAHGGATEIQAHPFFNTVDWQKYALRQVSPPFKPPVSADEDACDYNDRGRSFDWMFRDGQCWQSTDHVEALGDLDSEGLFRDFSFTGVGGRPEVGAWGGRRSSYDGTPP